MRTIVDYEHLGKVLAERQRVGKGRIYDILAERRYRKKTLYERVTNAA
jgi:predicted site-specific integrase-resolvase